MLRMIDQVNAPIKICTKKFLVPIVAGR
ncbi:hypothetical protein DERP_009135 [Dermatophagoides pteronyssinus]|uniref:Uncharacterized protein n=1 Tax=Dermatophagoides pteronyssinus TaxID=6956 RepID=A0ABQ8JQM3_DERPT|nr:hypothetical protein DERP_009135 [Dermatophagoides pteronyssinus]